MKYTETGIHELRYTAVDECGNETTRIRTIEVVAMATVLYADGTLIINESPTDRDSNIALHGAVVKEYEPLDANNSYVLSRGDDQMWLSERNLIKSVQFGSAVQPTSMGYWFQNCQNLESIDWTNLDGSVNTSLRALFASTKLASFSGIPEMPNVELLRFMFNACERLVTCSMQGLNSSKVTDTNGMFQGCYNLEEVTLAFGDSNVQICGNMFSNYNGDGKGDMKLRKIYNTARAEGDSGLRDYPYFEDATTSTNMFRSCTSLVGGDGTTYDPSKINKAYARCDSTEASKLGYFTKI